MSNSIWFKISAGVTLICGIYTSYKVITYINLKKIKTLEVSSVQNEIPFRVMVRGMTKPKTSESTLAYTIKKTYFSGTGQVNKTSKINHLVISPQPPFEVSDIKDTSSTLTINLDELLKIRCEKAEITHQVMDYTFSEAFFLFIKQVSSLFTEKYFSPDRSIRTKTNRITSGTQVICLGQVDESSKVFKAEIIGSSQEAILDYYFKTIKTPAVLLAICASVTLVVRYVVEKDKLTSEESDQEIPDGLECSICMSRKKNIILWPCKHVCLCDQCIRNNVTSCPICRVRITHQFKIDY